MSANPQDAYRSMMEAKLAAAEKARAEAEARAIAAETKRAANSNFFLRCSEKGALSVYGVGQFPVSLYVSQWLVILDPAHVAQIMAAITSGEAPDKDGNLRRLSTVKAPKAK